MKTLGQPVEASCPSGEVVPAGGAVVVDAAVVMTRAMTHASRRNKKSMPVLILKPRGMIPESTNSLAQPRKPNIGNL